MGYTNYCKCPVGFSITIDILKYGTTLNKACQDSSVY